VPQTVSVALRPLDMLLLADRSGSMAGSKFSGTIAELDGFVAQPWPQGTSVGLVYHPAPGVANVCPLALYNPPSVPFEPVPANAGVLQTSLAMQGAGGLSPMAPELEGGLQYATAYKTSEPNHVVAAVLMMDSPANTCDTDISNNAALAAAALTFNGVLTFAVALPGGDVVQMNAIAQAGGTSAAIDLTNPANLSTLNAELSDIRNRLVPCEYALPPTPAGVTFDADEVNLSYTEAGVAMDIPRVADSGACGNTPGWFWDSPATPTTLVMCSATCQTIKQDMAPVVQVVFGCPTLEG
jgi:hypothetical protein